MRENFLGRFSYIIIPTAVISNEHLVIDWFFFRADNMHSGIGSSQKYPLGRLTFNNRTFLVHTFL